MNLKVGDIILAYNPESFGWIKCKVNRIRKSLITLEYIEGSLKGIIRYEIIGRLKNPDYYRMAK
ncbi:MAG: hypothetical protein GH151_09365 [Bacteroidetes bacterium]|nr:hypothetical protein [Bacteroidota bacterium]